MKRGDRGRISNGPTTGNTALLKKTAQAAQNGRFEPFKTTSGFDATAKHPEWLG